MRSCTYDLFRIAGLAGTLFLALTRTAVSQEISAANRSRYIGRDQWEWTVFIKASPQTLRDIRCVEYKLHPTFPNPNRKVCSIGNQDLPFALTGTGWGTFEIPIKVLFKNGKARILKHQLKFEGGAAERTLPITADNTASEVRKNWYKWTVFIKGPTEALDQARCVEYTLHHTFPNPVQEVCDRGTGRAAFALSASGWGTFRIGIRVFLKSGKIQELTHDLKF